MTKIDFDDNVGKFKSKFLLFALLQDPFSQSLLFQIVSLILYYVLYVTCFKAVFFKLFHITEKIVFCIVFPLSHYLLTTIISRGKLVYCDDKIDLKDKIAVVTGGCKGIGLEISIGLANLGCNVIMLGRDEARSEEVIKKLKEEYNISEKCIHFVKMDLDDFASIKKAANDIITKFKNVDFIVNNAGIATNDDKDNPKSLSKHFDNDKVFSTNVIGHYIFTELLLPALNEQGRVINMSSIANLLYKPKSKRKLASYHKSKLANIQHAAILQRKFIATDKNCNAYSCAPGIVPTELNDEITEKYYGVLHKVVQFFIKTLGKTPKEAAQIVIFLCVSPEYRLDGGSYYNNMQIGYTSKYASDPKSQKKLYTKADKLYKELYSKSKD